MKYAKSVIITAFMIFITAFAIFINDISKFLPFPPTNESFEYAAVLTGGKNRISYSLDLALKYQLKNIFISGVNQKTSIKEILNTEDCKDIKIFLGRKATNTLENALEISEWTRNNNTRKILLVTSDYHMIRSLTIFKKIFDNSLQIFPVAVPSKRDSEFLKNCFKEFFKVIFFKLFSQLYNTRNY